MPEGDTIHKVAAVLARELVGKELTEVQIQGVYGSERLAGARITQIEPLGKHTLLHFDRDVILRVHLGMKGSWHQYPPGARWKRAKQRAGVVLKTADSECVCFDVLDLELIPAPQRKWHRTLNSLGPDLLAEVEPEWAEVIDRVYRLHKEADFLGEVLLDQRVAAGIGNVYKSELCFMGDLDDDPFTLAPAGYNPWLPLGRLTPEQVMSLFRRARSLLFANLGGWFRTTTVDRRQSAPPPEGNLYVYGRDGEPCRRCGELIKVDYQGLQHRITYWCPGCQSSA